MALLLLAAPARAQLGASATLQSDDQYRGHSLSDRRPALGLNISYDHISGAYGGASLILPTHDAELSRLGLVGYAGYVARLGTGPALDVGVTDSSLIGYRYPKHRVDYQEVYAGLLGDHLSFHAHYSPNYFHSGLQTLYVDLDGAVRPTDDWRVFGHVGALTPLSGLVAHGSRKERYDLSLGVARKLPHAEVSLVWSRTTPVVVLPGGRPQDRAALALSAAYFF